MFSRRKEIIVAAMFLMVGAILSLRTPAAGEVLGLVSSLKGKSAVVKNVRVWDGNNWKKIKGHGYAKLNTGGRVYCTGIELRKNRYPEYILSRCYTFPVDLDPLNRMKLYVWEKRENIERLNTLTAKMLISTPDEIANKAGVSHIFAVSGFHIGIYFTLALVLVSSFISNMFVAYPLSLFIAFMLAVQSGPSPSAIRALIFITVWAIFKLIDYPISILNVLGIAALMSLLEDVYIIFSPSFLMSYSGTFGILVSLKNKEKWYLVPFWAYLYSLPFSILFFDRINLLSPFVSLFVSPYISILVASGAVFSLLNILGLENFSRVLFTGLKPLEFPVVKLFQFISRFPAVELHGIYSVVLSFALMVVIVWLTRKRLSRI
ncbi:MAG: ComEC/Rec2 family competence protein [Thermotogaceae bacterium]|nr:ComEC/Rec2 family competence protein [Thermotogaceae bacterium]